MKHMPSLKRGMSQGRLSMVFGNGQIRLGWQNLIAQAKGFTLIEVIIIIVLVAILDRKSVV